MPLGNAAGYAPPQNPTQMTSMPPPPGGSGQLMSLMNNLLLAKPPQVPKPAMPAMPPGVNAQGFGEVTPGFVPPQPPQQASIEARPMPPAQPFNIGPPAGGADMLAKLVSSMPGAMPMPGPGLTAPRPALMPMPSPGLMAPPQMPPGMVLHQRPMAPPPGGDLQQLMARLRPANGQGKAGVKRLSLTGRKK